MGKDDDPKSLLEAQIYLLLIIFGSAALVISIYHLLKVAWRNHRLHSSAPAAPRQPPNSAESSMVELIPAYKYQKGMDLAGDDGACAVCLCDYVDGDELRTLPECSHTFHAPCIDMWLYSHSNCPICRADAVRMPKIGGCSGPQDSEQHGSNVVPEMVV